MAAVAAARAGNKPRGSENTPEMRLYFEKLKNLIPCCLKNGTVTKLQLIQHVIDYISDLQDSLQSDSELESPPQSPVDHVSFSDVFDLQPQSHGYGTQPIHFARFSGSAMVCDSNYANDHSRYQGFAGGYDNAYNPTRGSGYSNSFGAGMSFGH